MYRVKSFETGQLLDGLPTPALLRAFGVAKREATLAPTADAMPAYLERGVWVYVKPEHQQGAMLNGHDVVPVGLVYCDPCDRCGVALEATSVCSACAEEHAGIPDVCPSCKTDNLITVWGAQQLARYKDGRRFEKGSTDIDEDGPRCNPCRGLS